MKRLLIERSRFFIKNMQFEGINLLNHMWRVILNFQYI